MLQAKLKVTSGKQAGSTIPLPLGKFLVGREEDCHLRPNSDMVSRHHCVFTIDEYAVRVRDLGSTNGTLVNGERIRGGVVLKAGDIVTIGKLDFEVVMGDAANETTKANFSLETSTSVPGAMPVDAEVSEAGTILSESPLSESPTPLPEVPVEEPSTSATLTEFPVMLPNAQMQMYPPSGDTQFGYPGMQMPQQPMGYPMGYPQQMMPYGYPQQQMPGYPQMMPGYPQMPGYPPQQMPGYPPQQMPAQMPIQEQPPAQEAFGGKGNESPVKLPDPSTTGAKPPEPKPVAPVASGDGAKSSDQKAKEEAPGSAADIIQQYLKRRPGSTNQ